jgi:anaerobic ribonucleoside-triphosphate reductase activating protein
MEAEPIINVARWLSRSSVNGPGERFVLWVQGCPIHCPGCWNPDTWSFAANRLMTVSDVFNLIGESAPIDGVTFTGGEPFAQAQSLAVLADRLKRDGVSLMAFTGFELDELASAERARLLDLLDIVVTGRFKREERAEGLTWRGSSNQQVHFLSSRHRASESQQAQEPQAEVVISDSGGAIVTGFPCTELRRKLRIHSGR